MNTTDDSHFVLLSNLMEDHGEEISFEYLCKYLSISRESACCLLERYRNSKENVVNCNYIVSGKFPDESVAFIISPQHKLEEAKSRFMVVSDIQLFSISSENNKLHPQTCWQKETKDLLFRLNEANNNNSIWIPPWSGIKPINVKTRNIPTIPSPPEPVNTSTTSSIQLENTEEVRGPAVLEKKASNGVLPQTPSPPALSVSPKKTSTHIEPQNPENSTENEGVSKKRKKITDDSFAAKKQIVDTNRLVGKNGDNKLEAEKKDNKQNDSFTTNSMGAAVEGNEGNSNGKPLFDSEDEAMNDVMDDVIDDPMGEEVKIKASPQVDPNKDETMKQDEDGNMYRIVKIKKTEVETVTYEKDGYIVEEDKPVTKVIEKREIVKQTNGRTPKTSISPVKSKKKPQQSFITAFFKK